MWAALICLGLTGRQGFCSSLLATSSNREYDAVVVDSLTEGQAVIVETAASMIRISISVHPRRVLAGTCRGAYEVALQRR